MRVRWVLPSLMGPCRSQAQGGQVPCGAERHNFGSLGSWSSSLLSQQTWLSGAAAPPETLPLHPPTHLEALCKHGDAAAVITAAFERTQGSSASEPPAPALPISLNWIICVYLLILHICHQGRVEEKSFPPRALASPRRPLGGQRRPRSVLRDPACCLMAAAWRRRGSS